MTDSGSAGAGGLAPPTEAELKALRTLLFRYAASRLADPFDAEDVVSEALLVAVSRPPGSGNLDAYLLGVVKNKIADHYRRLARVQPAEAEVLTQLAGSADPREAPGARLEAAEVAARARHALSLLAERDRDLLSLRMAGATVEQTAQALSMSNGATRVAQTRALKRFNAVLAEVGGV